MQDKPVMIICLSTVPADGTYAALRAMAEAASQAWRKAAEVTALPKKMIEPMVFEDRPRRRHDQNGAPRGPRRGQ